MRRREPVAAPQDDPQAKFAGQVRRGVQLSHERIPIEAVPALDLGLGAAGHRAFREVDDRRVLRAGLLHEPPDLSTVLTDVWRNQALGRGDGYRALAHECSGLFNQVLSMRSPV